MRASARRCLPHTDHRTRPPVLTYIDSSAVRAGLSEDFSFYLVAIANASSAIGRAGSGLIADRIGTSHLALRSARESDWANLRLSDDHDSVHVPHWRAYLCLAIRAHQRRTHCHCRRLRVRSPSSILLTAFRLTSPDTQDRRRRIRGAARRARHAPR